MSRDFHTVQHNSRAHLPLSWGDKWKHKCELTSGVCITTVWFVGFKFFVTKKRKDMKGDCECVVSQKRLVTEEAFNTTLCQPSFIYSTCIAYSYEWQQAEENEVLCFQRITKWVIMNYCNFHWFNSSTISSEMWPFAYASFFPYSLSLHYIYCPLGS